MTAEDLLDGYDELGGGGAQERDWKGITIALFVIIMICSLIGIALILFTPLTEASHVTTKRMELSDIQSTRYPVGDMKLVGDSIVMQSWMGVEQVTDGVRKVLFLRDGGDEIKESYDNRMFASLTKAPNPGLNPENVTYYVKVYNAATKIATHIGSERERSTLQAFQWNTNNNDFAFIENNEVYYQTSAESRSVRHISDGAKTRVHGLFDWIYTEEIFQKREALWWSPDGNMLAFASHDGRLTRNVTLKSYQRLQSYPIDSALPYPKTFAKRLPTYTVSIWDKVTDEVKQLDVQLTTSSEYHYLIAVKWLLIDGAPRLVLVWANRYQNEISITICAFENAICSLAFEYSYSSRRWASPDDFESMIAHNDQIFFLLPRDLKDNAFQHIVRLKITPTSGTPEFIALGHYDVAGLIGIDADGKKVFYRALAPNPGQMSVYSVGIDDSPTESPECVTCHIKNCTYVQILDFDKRNLLVTCKGPIVPHTILIDLEKLDKRNTSIYKPAFDEKEFTETFNRIDIPTVIYDTFRINNEFEARISLTIPAGLLTKDKPRTVPLLVYVYAGPNDIQVNEMLKVGYEEYLSSHLQIAVLRIDGRGSGGRGWKYRSAVYGQLGTVEADDQLVATKMALEKYAFLDPSRVAVFGWSYGGFMAIRMVEASGKASFRCAVSVAPVTNFAYYDATYTERYMGNAPISDYVDVTKNVQKFKETKLLLMHGLVDDNVHFQNSALLIEELQSRGIDFDLMIYPNENHQIYSKKSHVHGKIAHFLSQCFR
ncbi:unnamed protein product [Caenorhabditis bovis]|uniref:Uncharacterized protein n=1 Tax=Caenorhabditis bovis TaxID=2654633 RepID=A0A8S1ED74_9PELO|nr:unnamed protein product [Caenorhabditis bovis]